jgi:hypothetical protein
MPSPIRPSNKIIQLEEKNEENDEMTRAIYNQHLDIDLNASA